MKQHKINEAVRPILNKDNTVTHERIIEALIADLRSEKEEAKESSPLSARISMVIDKLEMCQEDLRRMYLSEE